MSTMNYSGSCERERYSLQGGYFDEMDAFNPINIEKERQWQLSQHSRSQHSAKSIGLLRRIKYNGDGIPRSIKIELTIPNETKSTGGQLSSSSSDNSMLDIITHTARDSYSVRGRRGCAPTSESILTSQGNASRSIESPKQLGGNLDVAMKLPKNYSLSGKSEEPIKTLALEKESLNLTRNHRSISSLVRSTENVAHSEKRGQTRSLSPQLPSQLNATWETALEYSSERIETATKSPNYVKDLAHTTLSLGVDSTTLPQHPIPSEMRSQTSNHTHGSRSQSSKKSKISSPLSPTKRNSACNTESRQHSNNDMKSECSSPKQNNIPHGEIDQDLMSLFLADAGSTVSNKQRATSFQKHGSGQKETHSEGHTSPVTLPHEGPRSCHPSFTTMATTSQTSLQSSRRSLSPTRLHSHSASIGKMQHHQIDQHQSEESPCKLSDGSRSYSHRTEAPHVLSEKDHKSCTRLSSKTGNRSDSNRQRNDLRNSLKHHNDIDQNDDDHRRGYSLSGQTKYFDLPLNNGMDPAVRRKQKQVNDGDVGRFGTATAVSTSPAAVDHHGKKIRSNSKYMDLLFDSTAAMPSTRLAHPSDRAHASFVSCRPLTSSSSLNDIASGGNKSMKRSHSVKISVGSSKYMDALFSENGPSLSNASRRTSRSMLVNKER